MKTYAYSLLLTLSLAVGACAGESATTSQVPSINTSGVVARSSGGSARREFVASSSDVDREPVGSYRAERGVPTPQPAREPSFFAGPVPQPPLPNPDGNRSSRSVSRDSY